MAAIQGTAIRELLRIMQTDNGLPFSVASLGEREQLALPTLEARHILTQYIAADIAEKAQGVRYPVVYVYCEKVVNNLKEKFRTFSGAATMSIEIRVSHDRLEELARHLDLYVEAVTNVLDSNRGEWTAGVCFTGGYEITFGPVKHGGKNFLQVAKVRFELNLSAN